MHCNLRETLLNSAQYICIVAKWKVRISSTLHKNFCTINSNRFSNFLINRFIWQHIAFIRAWSAVKSTKTAVHITYIRIVNITTNYKRGHRVWMPAFHYGVCSCTHFLNFVALEQSDGIFQLETVTPQGFIQNKIYRTHRSQPPFKPLGIW
ncbi:hypothetical protein D3C76_1158250 [compost metagenome]